jgi:hypothetical protein
MVSGIYLARRLPRKWKSLPASNFDGSGPTCCLRELNFTETVQPLREPVPFGAYAKEQMSLPAASD